jgi:hypothetical protein
VIFPGPMERGGVGDIYNLLTLVFLLFPNESLLDNFFIRINGNNFFIKNVRNVKPVPPR